MWNLKKLSVIKGVILEYELDKDCCNHFFASEGDLAIWKDLAIG